MDSILVTIAGNIKKYRELRKLTPEQLGGKMGIGKAGIYKWEKGETTPSIEKLTDVAAALDIKLIDLFKENHTPVQMASDSIEKPLGGEAAIYKELYEKFLGEKSLYLVIHRDVLRDHRLVAVERLEEDKERAAHDRAAIDQKTREVEQRSLEIQSLTTAIREIATRPINIQLSDVKRTQE